MSVVTQDKFTESRRDFYGRWLPIPVLEKITVSDYTITPQISISLKTLDDVTGTDEENAPTDVYNHIIKNLNFYVMWSLGESTHESVVNRDTHIYSMLSSSAEMNQNLSRMVGMKANFVNISFEGAETSLVEVRGEKYYKWVASADIEIGEADDSDTEDENEERKYSFNPINDDFMWGTGYFDVPSVFSDAGEIEEAKSYFHNLYLYSFCSPKFKSDEEYVGTNSEVYEGVHKDRLVLDMLCSDISWHQVFKSTPASNSTPVLNTEPYVVYIPDPNSLDGTYNGIPILGLDGFYYRSVSLTFRMIKNSFARFFSSSRPELAEPASGTVTASVIEDTPEVDNLKFIFDKFMYTPRILVELNDLLKAWPEKTADSALGGVYLALSNVLARLNNTLRIEERVEKQFYYNNVIIDDRGSGFADWCAPHTTFLGDENIPDADERIFSLPNVGGSSEFYTPYSAGSTSASGQEIPVTTEDYVIYPHYYMHRAGLNLEAASSDEASSAGVGDTNYTFADIVNKGYFFIDYERIINNYVLISQLWSMTSIHNIFGRELTNLFIEEQALNFVRYNSDLSYGTFGSYFVDKLPDNPIKEFVVQFDSEVNYPLASSIIHENIAEDYAGIVDSVGYATLNVTSEYEPGGTVYRSMVDPGPLEGVYEEDTGSEYRDYNVRHSYVVPRNFDVLNQTNLRDNLNNYRLLCMAFEDYYPFDIATDWQHTIDTVSTPYANRTTEYYHVVFHIKDKSIELVSKLISEFYEVYEQFKEYAQYAVEACSYNATTDTFNSFFINAMNDLYGTDDPPYEKAAMMYNLHSDLLWFVHGGDINEISEATQQLAVLVSPESGTLMGVKLLEDSLEQIYELYAGYYDYDPEDESTTYSASWVPGAVYQLFSEYGWTEFSGSPLQFVPSGDVDMKFEQILECFPPILYTNIEEELQDELTSAYSSADASQANNELVWSAFITLIENWNNNLNLAVDELDDYLGTGPSNSDAKKAFTTIGQYIDEQIKQLCSDIDNLRDQLIFETGVTNYTDYYNAMAGTYGSGDYYISNTTADYRDYTHYPDILYLACYYDLDGFKAWVNDLDYDTLYGFLTGFTAGKTEITNQRYISLDRDWDSSLSDEESAAWISWCLMNWLISVTEVEILAMSDFDSFTRFGPSEAEEWYEDHP